MDAPPESNPTDGKIRPRDLVVGIVRLLLLLVALVFAVNHLEKFIGALIGRSETAGAVLGSISLAAFLLLGVIGELTKAPEYPGFIRKLPPDAPRKVIRARIILYSFVGAIAMTTTLAWILF